MLLWKKEKEKEKKLYQVAFNCKKTDKGWLNYPVRYSWSASVAMKSSEHKYIYVKWPFIPNIQSTTLHRATIAIQKKIQNLNKCKQAPK
jgi:hypothetical protein